MISHFAIVTGDHNGPFMCAIKFGFNPSICVSAPPKIRDVFLNRSLEKCRGGACAD